MAELAAEVLTQASSARRFVLSGHVQGVGFRPFVYRLAQLHGLTGRVQNQLGEVEIIVAGPGPALQEFERDLIRKAPPLSRPAIDEAVELDGVAFATFEISPSSVQADARIFVPHDFFMCDECRAELNDPADRRYRYPFINCTQCGPRYTLIEALPYDRPNTSMAAFPLCADCNEEYLDPGDRRFHAEPVACPACGPQLSFHDQQTGARGAAENALQAALDSLRAGNILAVKGIGGYHLMCDAGNEKAVGELRHRKQRPMKPLAVMFPLRGDDGLDAVREYARPTSEEEDALISAARPIVLIGRKDDNDLAASIASGLAEIGVFLPYSPLHQLLLDEFDGPLVATSANISGEPVLTENSQVELRLTAVVDAYLHHDRPIVRPADDPVFRRIAGAVRPLRVGRGSAPVELSLPYRQQQPVLAVGGHMKGTVALSWDERVVVSPHIGEMDSPRSLAVFEQVASDLQNLYGVRAERIVSDAHSGYTTHKWAHAQALPVDVVYHHAAHASALAGERALTDQGLIFTWDGVGLGEDGTLWGGEALLGRPGQWQRIASLRPFRLPGGDRAGREPWRSAAALYWSCERSWPDSPDTDGLLQSAWRANLNSPQTSAAGRVFDAAAALIIDATHTSFEAEGPMLLESLCTKPATAIELPLAKDGGGIWRSDWEPLLDVIADKNKSRRARAEIFHTSMAHAVLQQAQRVREQHAVNYVGLSGGVFQNRILTEQIVNLLQQNDFDVVLPLALPCNDAGLSFGQAVELAARQANR